MKFTYRSAMSILRFASDIANKLPVRGDGWVGSFVKVLAIADSAEKQWGRRSTSIIMDMHDIREMRSGAFTKLFFQTDAHKSYSIRRWGSDPHLEIIEARSPDGERLFFQEYRLGRVEMSDEFFHTSGFSFTGAVERLWSGYPDGLYLTTEIGEYGSRDVKFCAAPPSLTALLSKKAADRLHVAIAAHKETVASGVHRCYMFSGPPGTGKTSFAIGLSRENGGRLLNMDATSLPHFSVRELGFLLDVLRPGFLVIDDFDEAPAEGVSARLRFLLSHLKATRSDMTIILTVNDPTRLDAALLRSGRVDEVLDFELPGADERTELAAKLLDHYGVTGISALTVAGNTEGYNHADLASLVERLRRGKLEDTLRVTGRLRELAGKAIKTGQPTSVEKISKVDSPN